MRIIACTDVDPHPCYNEQTEKYFYLVNAAEEDVGVPLRGPESLEALRDIAAGGKVEEDLRVHRPCTHALPRLSCVNGHRVTRIMPYLFRYRKMPIFRTPFWLCDVFTLSNNFLQKLCTSQITFLGLLGPFFKKNLGVRN